MISPDTMAVARLNTTETKVLLRRSDPLIAGTGFRSCSGSMVIPATCIVRTPMRKSIEALKIAYFTLVMFLIWKLITVPDSRLALMTKDISTFPFKDPILRLPTTEGLLVEFRKNFSIDVVASFVNPSGRVTDRVFPDENRVRG